MLKIENLSAFYGKKQVIFDLSAEFKSGRFTAILGRNGSGKSTLLSCLASSIRYSGKILLDGEDIWEKPKNIGSVRYRVGLVMQYPEYQLFEETVYKDIAYGPKNMGLSDEDIDERVQYAAHFTGITREMVEENAYSPEPVASALLEMLTNEKYYKQSQT
mgnify:CR=1 FL=1